MASKNKTSSLIAKWELPESPAIYKANAFRSVYTPHSIVMYIGLVDPEDMLPAVRKSGKVVEIKTLGRYCLDIDDFLRLKTEVDKTFEGLTKAGALKNGK